MNLFFDLNEEQRREVILIASAIGFKGSQKLENIKGIKLDSEQVLEIFFKEIYPFLQKVEEMTDLESLKKYIFRFFLERKIYEIIILMKRIKFPASDKEERISLDYYLTIDEQFQSILSCVLYFSRGFFPNRKISR